MGQRVTGTATPRATIYRITGFGLFADWHVWKLAWTVLHGHYAEDHDAAPAATPHTWRSSASMVLHERRFGLPAQGPRPSRRALEAYRETYRPECATLVVVGAFEADALRREIVTLFGGWRAAAAARTEPLATEFTVVTGPASIAVTMPYAPTVELAIGIPVADLSLEAQRVLAAVIDDRLRVVREGLGAAYSLSITVYRDAVVILGAVEPRYAREAATAIAAELERVRSDDSIVVDYARARNRVYARALARSVGGFDGSCRRARANRGVPRARRHAGPRGGVGPRARPRCPAPRCRR